MLSYFFSITVETQEDSEIKIICTFPCNFHYTHAHSNTRAHKHTGIYNIGLICLEVTCSTRGPRFASSDLTEIDGFFDDIKFLIKSTVGGTLSSGS